MIVKVLMALGMVGLMVAIHAAGLVIVLRAVALTEPQPRPAPRLLSIVWLLIWVPLTLIMIHLFEIGLWASFFWWKDCFADAGTSLYFAGSSYTTLGYGDLVLPAEWRLFGPLAALTGVLCSGLSVGSFVAVMIAVNESAILQDRLARTFRRGTLATNECGSRTSAGVNAGAVAGLISDVAEGLGGAVEKE
jgi:hypothetical protein